MSLTASEAAPSFDDVHSLQARIRQMQATTLESRSLHTHPALADLLPGGSLRAGSTYSVEGSTALVMALLAGPSSSGAWCGVVGVPDFGTEAAGRMGIDLERLVLVPYPGGRWLTVTAAVIDVLTVVVTRPPTRTSDGNIARLTARLRQRGATLIVLGDWPQSEARLTVSENGWEGLGAGFGYLSGRQATVTVTARASMGFPRSERLWLPDPHEQFRVADQQPSDPFSREAAG